MRRSSLVAPALEQRSKLALEELDKLLADAKDFPINYNNYYTDTIQTKRRERMLEQLQNCTPGVHEQRWTTTTQIIETTVENWFDADTADMEDFSCNEALDCLAAIYEV